MYGIKICMHYLVPTEALSALTHTPTHCAKGAHGFIGQDLLFQQGIAGRKGPESAVYQAFDSLMALRNQQVVCSSHIASSKKYRFSREKRYFWRLRGVKK